MPKKQPSDKAKPPNKNRTAAVKRQMLGPVPNLEEHVRPDWWRGLFNSLYLKTDADVIDDRAITRQEVELFSSILNLSPNQSILDLCCGQGRHALELARSGFKSVEGLDRSHYLIHRAKGQAKAEVLPVKFREGDARKLPFNNDSFDVVTILGNSFGYFESVRDDLQVLKEVRRVLKPNGRLLVDVSDGRFVREKYQPRSWEWIDKKHFVCRERSLSRDGDRLITREVITNVEKGVIVDQFYAERLYSDETLGELMTDAGFSDFKIDGGIATNSQRNQDLGMMAQRLVATVSVKKEWTKSRHHPRPVQRNIVVVLGDPNRPDALKPLRIFDEDDFHTIEQLKSALAGLKDYKFTYLDNHATLFQDLKRLQGRFDMVLNLCDEGFDNDPRKELHVPALLEQLGLPYSGSGPACLAFCYDKSAVRGVAKEMGIPVPAALFIKPEDNFYGLPVGFPVIAKPNYGDSSFGITRESFATNREELVNALIMIRDKLGYEKPILVEEFLAGKDLSIGFIGNPPENYRILPLIEEDYSELPEEYPRICGYEAKWLPDSPYWKLRAIPAELPKEAKRQIIEHSLKLFERLDCRDYVRFDWRLDAEGNPKLLEVNPNPGWCWDGHLAKMSKIDGIDYPAMLLAIIRAAEHRLGINNS